MIGFDLKNIESLVKTVQEQVPAEFGAAPESVKNQVKSILENMMADMGCVSREEFEKQKAVLQKTRSMVEVLQKRLDDIEQK